MSQHIPSAAIEPKYFRLAVLCLVVFAAFNAAMLWRVRSSIAKGYGDFTPFYTAGKIVNSGQSARLYDPALEWQIQQQFAANVSSRRGPLPYIRPPFEALLFLPLSVFPYPVACAVWMACKILSLLAVCFLLPRAEGVIDSWKFRILLCLAFSPVGFDFLQGQDSILILLILTVCLRLLLKGAEFPSGAVLALGLFKFHLILPLLLIMIFKRRGRFAFGFAAIGTALFLISLLMVGWTGIANYPKMLLSLKPELGAVRVESMPNFRGLLTCLLGQSSFRVAVQPLLLTLGMVSIGFAAASWRSNDSRSTLFGFSLSIVVAIVSSYYANRYDLTLLLLPMLILAHLVLQSGSIGWQHRLFMASSAVLLCTPLLWLVALKLDQFCWMAVVLIALGVSIAAMSRVEHETLMGMQAK